ncbi:hypothetical protein [Methanococcoides sp.]|uniref:hypothetical protein n=1 Tax=Methanococcoides sp. TaxID=1966350 RepID=UPI00272ECE55|nr:hypothetical protein [Methanococcoides sp.]
MKNRRSDIKTRLLLRCVFTSADTILVLADMMCATAQGDAVEATTDSDGVALIKLDKSGNWMFKVRYADLGKGIEDQYDEKVITAVLTVMGIH